MEQRRVPVAWMSHEYMARTRRGDQSRRPFRNASWPDEMTLPRALDHLERTGSSRSAPTPSDDRKKARTLGDGHLSRIEVDRLDKVRHPDDGLGAERSAVHRELERGVKVLVELAHVRECLHDLGLLKLSIKLRDVERRGTRFDDGRVGSLQGGARAGGSGSDGRQRGLALKTSPKSRRSENVRKNSASRSGKSLTTVKSQRCGR